MTLNRGRLALFVASLAALIALTGAAAQAAENESAAKEKALIDTLRSAPAAEKALACKQLAIHGSKEAVPELARLLPDEQLNSWARIALEAIPDPAADDALRGAVDSLSGRLLVGTINSVGIRRDAKAVEQLTARMKDSNADVAAAAAVALGHIAGAPATKVLRQSLPTAEGALRAAVAEGCILCAERLVAEGKTGEAAEIYDEVRRAQVPKQKVLEATRGAILARGPQGLPLLIEQLRSADKQFLQVALSTARELQGRDVTTALAAEVGQATPERAALLLYALADRAESVIPPAVFQAAKAGDPQVRIAAIGVVGRLGDAASLPELLAIATDANAGVAQAAQTALVGLPGEQVNQEIADRLANAQGKALPVLIELVGQRRIDAKADLVKALDHQDPAVRQAALAALGETAKSGDISVLVARVVNPPSAEESKAAERALRAAATRMPDREACAAELAAAMSRAPVQAQVSLLEILGAMGGPKALAAIAEAMKGNEEQLRDAGSRVLGAWMTVDAAPVLLEQAKTGSGDKYRVRALRGYIRLARQFTMPEAERAEMCRQAIAAAERAEEQQLVLAVLERYPNVETLKVAIKATELPAAKEGALHAVQVIGNKIGGQSPEARELLAKLGFEPVKIEIIKAEYGAGTQKKDVTEVLKRRAGSLPMIDLPSANYNESFGGDPAPGVVKQLTLHYRINGKPADASFAENATLVLPMPK
jgi:HEAT repeat protein